MRRISFVRVKNHLVVHTVNFVFMYQTAMAIVKIHKFVPKKMAQKLAKKLVFKEV